MQLEELLAAASAWRDQDPDPQTRAELDALIAARDVAELESRFGARIGFGTAGLRGELGAGPNRMNRVLVAQAAAGIAAYLLENREELLDKNGRLGVIIGFDGRVNSDVFAEDSAQIFAGAGIDAWLIGQVPTPVLAFATKHWHASAGIMVTASHNPPRDNGYKVYLGGATGGSQIISPSDKDIAAKIAEVAATHTFDSIPKSLEFNRSGEHALHEYVNATANLIGAAPIGPQPKIVYTAMHGVGWHTSQQLFALTGIDLPAVVVEQNEPDGAFPTVAFPNPEEPGALDLAYALAREQHADLIIANDPDADRLAVAIPDASAAEGYRRLTGDEIGLVLGDRLAEWWVKRGQPAAADGSLPNLACSIVSSSALGAVAAHYGLGFKQTLTGFKWISKVPNLLFGYEEALGYCVDLAHTPDKDGISASLVIADLAIELHQAGSNLAEHIAALGERYGHFATGQISIRVTDLNRIVELMARVRGAAPTELCGQGVTFTDLALGSAELPPTDGVRLDLADGRRVIIRPSGTEPKLKCYLQAVGASASDAKAKLAELDAAMREVLS
ncbi:MAG: phospho-sugar mutase [Actinomycetales bacterium]|nr:phospho-sugar mutase [Actinomycetales bacterium]